MDDTTFQQKNEQFKECSFCKIPRHGVSTVIIGQDACICPNCTIGIHKYLIEKTGIRPNIQIIEEKQVLSTVKSIMIVIAIVIVTMITLFFIYKK